MVVDLVASEGMENSRRTILFVKGDHPSSGCNSDGPVHFKPRARIDE